MVQNVIPGCPLFRSPCAVVVVHVLVRDLCVAGSCFDAILLSRDTRFFVLEWSAEQIYRDSSLLVFFFVSVFVSSPFSVATLVWLKCRPRL